MASDRQFLVQPLALRSPTITAWRVREVYASLEKGIAEFRSAETGPKSHTCKLLLITFTYTST